MRRLLKNNYMRFTAWMLIVSTTTLIMPVGAFCSPQVGRKSSEIAGRKVQSVNSSKVSEKPAKRPDVRELTDGEMASYFGSGDLRNRYFCGAMPWHRSLRDVNLCTGNLFKSFTDIQVAPGRGAGLVLQRSYNSNDDREGPFGRGWTHAYDIRMEEAPSGLNNVDQTDFFGGKHTYKRDADGLYTPPVYKHDWLVSDYSSVLEIGPGDVASDTDTGIDGTIKHYVSHGDERVCDYIEDKFGNRTELAYNEAGQLDTVTVHGDPQNTEDTTYRRLEFKWSSFGQDVYRITQVKAVAVVEGVSTLQTVDYTYYTDSAEIGAGGEAYNLKTVTVYPGNNKPARTTTYAYTSVEVSGHDPEKGLLSSITYPRGTDTVGHEVKYGYQLYVPGNPTGYSPTNGTLWVTRVEEPGGVDAAQVVRSRVFWILFADYGAHANRYCTFVAEESLYDNDARTCPSVNGLYTRISAYSDSQYRCCALLSDGFEEVDAENGGYYGFRNAYDNNNNVTRTISTTNENIVENASDPACYQNGLAPKKQDNYTYGRLGNVLTHWIGPDPKPHNGPFSKKDTYTYYGEDKYFQKASVTDMAGNVTTFDYGSRYEEGDNIGKRGNVLWVRNAAYSKTRRQFEYTYNEYGQKTSEKNLNNVVTQYYYEDDWGNLTRVIQDPGGLSRTTVMEYNDAGLVIERTDPKGDISTITYNGVGQPLQIVFPTTEEYTPGETISYDYGDNGQLNSVTDGRGTTTMQYETGCDRVKSVTDPVDGTIYYTYTPSGSIATKTICGGVWEYTYKTNIDSTEPRAQLTQDDPNSYAEIPDTITDDEGRVITMVASAPTDIDGKKVRFNEHYVDGELQSYCTTSVFLEGEYTYNPGSSIPHAFYTHGNTRKVVNKYYHRTNPYQTPVEFPSTVLTENEYTYDELGNRLTNKITIENGQRVEEYRYDELNQLTGVNYGDGHIQEYTFDPMGNRLQKYDSVTEEEVISYRYNNANMLVESNGDTHSYDANGNLLGSNSSEYYNYWDSQNRMGGMRYDGMGFYYLSFTYGADGLRHSMWDMTNGVDTHYILDGQTVVKEKVNGTISTTYLPGPRGIEYRRNDAVIDADDIDPANPTRQRHEVKWYLYDGLGSVIAEVNNTGSLTATNDFDVYGLQRNSTGTSDSKHKFVGSLGHTTEPETGGLIYMRARYYDPAIGRFISEDPAGDGDNWYAYCGNNPINMVDPTGECFAVLLSGSGGSIAGEINYGTFVTAAGFGALAAVLVIIAGRNADISIATAMTDVLYSKRTKENDDFNRVSDKLGLTKDEQEALHRGISKKGYSLDELWKAADRILGQRDPLNRRGGAPKWKRGK